MKRHVELKGKRKKATNYVNPESHDNSFNNWVDKKDSINQIKYSIKSVNISLNHMSVLVEI